METWWISPKTATDNAITTSVAEEVGNASSAGNNRACSDEGSRKDRCSNDAPSIEEGLLNKTHML